MDEFDEEQQRIEELGHRERDLLEHPLTSWDAVEIPSDLTPEPPTMLHRTDGQALLYPGKTHSFVGEPESGKTWMALAAVAETIERGAGVMYVDFEDSAKGVVRRLVALGVPLAAVRQRFAYLRPDVQFTAQGAKHSLGRTGERYRPELIVLDGVTECMALHGWDINSATDVAHFLDLFPRLWEQFGAAVVMIDHVVKSSEAQGRWAIGSQHKLAGVNGASYVFEVTEVFGIGRDGQAKITVAKDREGEVRKFAQDGKIAGVFHLHGAENGSARWELAPYDVAASLRTFGEKILQALEHGPLSKRALHSAVGGADDTFGLALDDLRTRQQIKVDDEVGPGKPHLVSAL